MNDDELAQQVAMLAVSAAGAINGDVRGWQTRVAEYTPLIASMLKPPRAGKEDDATTPLVTARKVLDSVVFRAEFVGYEDDVNRKTGVKTHRLLVKLKSDTQNTDEVESDGTEHIRTEPNWTRAGYVMQRLVKSLSPGQQCVVHKHIEGFDGTDEKTGKSMKKNVKVLVHLEPVGRPPESSQSRPSESRGGPLDERQPGGDTAPSSPGSEPQTPPAGVSRGAGSVPPTDPAPESHGPHYAVVQERLEELTASQRVAWAALCRGAGIQRFMDPETTEDLDKVLVAFSKIGKDAQ